MGDGVLAVSPVVTYIPPLCRWLCKVSTIPMHRQPAEVSPGARAYAHGGNDLKGANVQQNLEVGTCSHSATQDT